MKAIARPYTEEESRTLKAEFLDIYTKSYGATIISCRHVKVPPSTFHYWTANDPEFKAACEEIKEFTKDKVEYSMIKSAVEKGGADRIFYMKCQMKDRGYTERERDLDEQRNGMRVVVEYKTNQADEDLKARIIAEYEASKLLSKPTE